MCLALVGLQLGTIIIIWQSTNGEEKVWLRVSKACQVWPTVSSKLHIKEELLTIAQRAQEVDAPIKWLTSSQLEIIDQDGIVTRIRLAR